MRRNLSILASLALALATATAAGSETTNVALGAAVSLHGAPFFTGGWPGGLVVGEQTLVDGVFLPRMNPWNLGPIWWDSQDLADRYITVELGASFRLDSLILQADNNDGYQLFARDPGSGLWEPLWMAPPVCCWGMETRPDPEDAGQRYVLPAPVTADALLIRGDLDSGDRYFAVSELQAFGARRVRIDVKPGSEPNCFHLDDRGVLPVALFGEEGFDVAQIDLESLSFAGLSVRIRSHRGPSCGFEAVDDDAFLDLMCHFEDDEAEWQGGEAEACLTARLLPQFGGMHVEGCDSICLVP